MKLEVSKVGLKLELELGIGIIFLTLEEVFPDGPYKIASVGTSSSL